MKAHRRIQERALSQHGIVTRADLEALDVTRPVRRRLVSDEVIVPCGVRTYRLAGAPMTIRHRAMWACLESGGATSHVTSSWLGGIPGFDAPRVPNVTVARRSYRYVLDGVDVHTTTFLPASHIVSVDGIPTMSVARTLFSLASLVPMLSAERVRGAVDDAIAARKATDQWLWWMLDQLRRRGRPGVAVFQQILVDRAGGLVTESWLERETIRILTAAGLPLPVCQARIEPDGAFVARVDFLYPELKLVIEVMGHRWHSTRQQLSDDSARRRRLTLAGYQVLDFTADQIMWEPQALVAAVEHAIRKRPAS